MKANITILFLLITILFSCNKSENRMFKILKNTGKNESYLGNGR